MAEQLISTAEHDTLPDSYVRPETQRPRLREVIPDAEIPVVDLADPDRAAVVARVAEACRTHGFFQVGPSGLVVLGRRLVTAVVLHADDTMARDFASLGFFNLCLAFVALELSTILTAGTATSAGAPVLLHSAAEILPPFAAVVVLFVAVALIYQHHLTGRRVVVAVPGAAAGAGNHGRRSISGLVIFALCVSAGTLEFIVFGQAAGGGTAEDHGAQARALGLAALRALPAAATATFFLGMVLVISAHVRAGGEGGCGPVAGDGPVQGPPHLLTKIAMAYAAALVGLMAMASLYGAKY